MNNSSSYSIYTGVFHTVVQCDYFLTAEPVAPKLVVEQIKLYQEKWTEEHRVYEYLSKEVKVDAEVDVKDVPPQPKKEMGATQKGKILIS